jgi:hypothetical protein
MKGFRAVKEDYDVCPLAAVIRRDYRNSAKGKMREARPVEIGTARRFHFRNQPASPFAVWARAPKYSA